jgi:hypothetical protein
LRRDGKTRIVGRNQVVFNVFRNENILISWIHYEKYSVRDIADYTPDHVRTFQAKLSLPLVIGGALPAAAEALSCLSSAFSRKHSVATELQESITSCSN